MRAASALLLVAGLNGAWAQDAPWRPTFLAAAACSDRFLYLYAMKTQESAAALGQPARVKCTEAWNRLRDEVRDPGLLVAIVQRYDQEAAYRVIDWRAGLADPPK